MMIGATEKIIRNLGVLGRGCGLNKWSGKALLRRWPLNREAKEVGAVSRVGPELGDYEIQGTVCKGPEVGACLARGRGIKGPSTVEAE